MLRWPEVAGRWPGGVGWVSNRTIWSFEQAVLQVGVVISIDQWQHGGKHCKINNVTGKKYHTHHFYCSR
jgi:hypothetical protein